MRLPLSVYRSRIGVQWADPSVRPSCVVTPRYSRWFMDGRSAPLSRPRKGWDSKMYPLTLSRHESEKVALGLSFPWRGGIGGVCNTPLPIRQEERALSGLFHPRKEWDLKMYLITLSRHESERAPLELFRPWWGGRGGVCNTPLRIRQEERAPLGLSRSRKEWDSKMYPPTLSRHESERAPLGLSRPWRDGRGGVCNTSLPCWKEERTILRLFRPWRGGLGGVCNTPLPCWKEERTILGLSRPWRGGLGGVCNTPLPCWKEERTILWLSCPWRGGRGADIFATCLYSFLVTITPRLTFHF